MRFQRSLNTGLVKSKWIKEEDEALKRAWEQGGDWKLISTRLPHRTQQQCIQRWRIIDSTVDHKTGRFTKAEDALLTAVYSQWVLPGHAPSWVSIRDRFNQECVRKAMQTRADTPLRERWVRNLSVTKGPWSDEDVAVLCAVIELPGMMKGRQPRWSKVTKHLREQYGINRADSDIKRKLTQLDPKQRAYAQKQHAINQRKVFATRA